MIKPEHDEASHQHYSEGLDTPLNAQERFLYTIAVRVDALCNMMSSFLEVYANEHKIATENVVEEIKQAVEEVQEVVKEVAPKKTRKRG